MKWSCPNSPRNDRQFLCGKLARYLLTHVALLCWQKTQARDENATMKRVNPFDRIRERLESRRRELLTSLSDELRELRNESDEQSWQDGEEEIDSMSDDVSSGLAERTSDELRQIENALK